MTMIKETLEEAAEKYYKLYEVKEGFIDGAKWMQEQFKNHLQKLDKLCGNK